MAGILNETGTLIIYNLNGLSISENHCEMAKMEIKNCNYWCAPKMFFSIHFEQS